MTEWLHWSFIYAWMYGASMFGALPCSQDLHAWST
jgi:hypothetical protein